MVALELKREGAVRWIVGGASQPGSARQGTGNPGRGNPGTGQDAETNKLTDTFFMGPPLPLLEQLFVIGETRGELRLLALDRSDGQLRWSQLLANVDQRAVLTSDSGSA